MAWSNYLSLNWLIQAAKSGKNSLMIPWALVDSATVYKNTALYLDDDGTLQVLEAIQRENLNALEEAKKGCL